MVLPVLVSSSQIRVPAFSLVSWLLVLFGILAYMRDVGGPGRRNPVAGDGFAIAEEGASQKRFAQRDAAQKSDRRAR